MASSAVVISTNPAVNNNSSLALGSKSVARKRTALVAEKRSNIEMVGEGGASEAGDEKVGSGRDLSHSIRGEMVLERPRDLLQAKKNLISSTVSPRRRKVVSKPEKPRWQTVLSVFTKNLLLLLVLLGLIQVIWKFSLKSADVAIGPMGMGTDFEGRIAEVDAFLKKTTKLMQVQVEVVDRKIESEVGDLRREFTKKVEEKGVHFDNELKKLEVRTDRLDKSFDELRATNFFTKEDFERFSDELKKTRSSEDEDKDWSLDDIRAFAREIVEKEIEKHAADGLGRVDYALASSGAAIVRHSEPFLVGKGNSWIPLTKSRNGVHPEAQKMLQPSFGEPGHCFPLKGNTGFVEIRLRTEIIPDAITLEHVAKSVAYDRSSAPKHCRIFGWLQGNSADQSCPAEKMSLLAEFTYDLEKSNAQTFIAESTGSGIINTVRLDFTSNHGSTTHTCIYRLRVHGREPESVLMLAAMQS